MPDDGGKPGFVGRVIADENRQTAEEGRPLDESLDRHALVEALRLDLEDAVTMDQHQVHGRMGGDEALQLLAQSSLRGGHTAVVDGKAEALILGEGARKIE